MKHELIKTEDYLLVVDDSELQIDNWAYHGIDGIGQWKGPILLNEEQPKNIIAHLPLNGSPVLKGVYLLPSQPTYHIPVAFEFEMRYFSTDEYIIETTTNSSGQTVWVGNYIFKD